MNKTYSNRYDTSFLFFVCLIFIIEKSESANILAVFPTPFVSHHIAFRPFVNELAKRGHQVTVITTDPEYPSGKTPQNLTEIDLHDISYKVWNEVTENQNRKEKDSMTRIEPILELINVVFEEQLKSPEVQELINDRKKTFDLIIVESMIRIAICFSYIYRAPVIEISSFGAIYETLDSTGAVTNPLIYPIIVRQRIRNLTIWEKFSEMYTEYKAKRSYVELEKNENKILKRIFGRHIPDIREMKNNVDMIFLNVHPLWDFNRPVPPNVIYLGGLQVKPKKQLPKDLEYFLDTSKNGVIYMSLGTNVKPSQLPQEKIQIFVNIFSQLPFNILWKWDNDTSIVRFKNIRTFKWCPQADLLRHPNIKLFITQGGLHSTDEAIAAGVPLIGIPMRTDQWYNTEMYTIRNIGLKIDIHTMTEDVFRNAIETVIKNPMYRQNVIKLRNIVHDQPQTSLERAVWWTEHVLRHGNAEHMRAPAAHMHWTEYYALDLVLVLLFAIIFIFISSLYIIHLVYSFLFKNILIRIRLKCIKTKED